MKYIIKITCGEEIRYITGGRITSWGQYSIDNIDDEGGLDKAIKASIKLIRLYKRYTFLDTRILCAACEIFIIPYHEELNNVR